MSKSKLSSAVRETILSSVATAGAAPLVQVTNVSRHQIVKSLAAAVALLAVDHAVDQSADAGSIVVQNPNVTVTAGSIKINSTFMLNLNTGNPGGIKSKGLGLWAVDSTNNRIALATKSGGNGGVWVATRLGRATATGAGMTWNAMSWAQVEVQVLVQNSDGTRPSFTSSYYLFSFQDSNNDKHYGWMLGTLTSNSYNLISYAYDTTPNQVIATGDTGTAAVPEPSSLALGAMGALVLGAAGVRKWKKDRQAKAV